MCWSSARWSAYRTQARRRRSEDARNALQDAVRRSILGHPVPVGRSRRRTPPNRSTTHPQVVSTMSLQRTFGGKLSRTGARLRSIALLAGAAACSSAPAPEPAPSPVAAPVSIRPLKVEQAPSFTPSVVQLTADSAAALAKADRAAIAPHLAPGLELNLWAAEPMIADPIGITFDDQGHLFATRTRRTGEGEIDIRGHQDWMVPSITFKDVEDKRAFYHNVLAPERSAQNQWLKDWNGDGSRDWRDLAFAKEGLYRIEDTNGDGVADKSTLILEDFNDLVSDTFH